MNAQIWNRLGRLVRAGGLILAAAFMLWRGFFFRGAGGPSVLIILMCFVLALMLFLAGITLLGETEESDAV